MLTHFFLHLWKQNTRVNYSLKTPNLLAFDANKWSIIRKQSSLNNISNLIKLSEESNTFLGTRFFRYLNINIFFIKDIKKT